MRNLLKVVFFCCSMVTVIFSQESLELSVTIPKDVYLTGELIEIGVNIINTGQSNIQLNEYSQLSFKMINEKDTILPYTGPIGELFTLNKRDFKPGEEEYHLYELNYFFGTRYSLLEKSFKPGTYTLEVILNLNNIQLKSKNVNFVIKNPEGEEAIIYSTWSQAIKDLPTGKYTHESFVSTLQSLLDKNPNTVYAPKILTLLETWYSTLLKNHEKATEVEKQLVENYTWSGRAKGMLESLLGKMSSQKEKIEYLKKIQSKSKNSLMEKIIENKLKDESKF